MAQRSSLGSLTKEPPLATLDATVRAITPGMRYDALLAYAAKNTLDVVPGLLAKRFLLLDPTNVIVYDRFLSLASTEGLESPRVRKVMYLVWALRDERLRRFIVERVADRDGKWKISALRNKANSKFLEQWLKGSSAKKARSNIEFFLQETGIYDSKGSGSLVRTRSSCLPSERGCFPWIPTGSVSFGASVLPPLKRITAPPTSGPKRSWRPRYRRTLIRSSPRTTCCVVMAKSSVEGVSPHAADALSATAALSAPSPDVPPNKRLKLAGAFRLKGSGVLCAGAHELSFNDRSACTRVARA